MDTPQIVYKKMTPIFYKEPKEIANQEAFCKKFYCKRFHLVESIGFLRAVNRHCNNNMVKCLKYVRTIKVIDGRGVFPVRFHRFQLLTRLNRVNKYIVESMTTLLRRLPLHLCTKMISSNVMSMKIYNCVKDQVPFDQERLAFMKLLTAVTHKMKSLKRLEISFLCNLPLSGGGSRSNIILPSFKKSEVSLKWLQQSKDRFSKLRRLQELDLRVRMRENSSYLSLVGAISDFKALNKVSCYIYNDRTSNRIMSSLERLPLLHTLQFTFCESASFNRAEFSFFCSTLRNLKHVILSGEPVRRDQASMILDYAKPFKFSDGSSHNTNVRASCEKSIVEMLVIRALRLDSRESLVQSFKLVAVFPKLRVLHLDIELVYPLLSAETICSEEETAITPLLMDLVELKLKTGPCPTLVDGIFDIFSLFKACTKIERLSLDINASFGRSWKRSSDIYYQHLAELITRQGNNLKEFSIFNYDMTISKMKNLVQTLRLLSNLDWLRFTYYPERKSHCIDHLNILTEVTKLFSSLTNIHSIYLHSACSGGMGSNIKSLAKLGPDCSSKKDDLMKTINSNQHSLDNKSFHFATNIV